MACYDAIYAELGAASGVGRSLDALMEVMIWSDDLAAIRPPYRIEISGTRGLPSDVIEEIRAIQQVIPYSIAEFRMRRHEDVDVSLFTDTDPPPSQTKFIHLDATSWKTTRDLADALCEALGAKAGVGRSPDALLEVMIWADDLADVLPPYCILISGASRLPDDFADFIRQFQFGIQRARREHRLRYGTDVEVSLVTDILPKPLSSALGAKSVPES